MKNLQMILQQNTLSPKDRVRIDILNELEKFKDSKKSPFSDEEIYSLAKGLRGEDVFEFEKYKKVVEMERDFRTKLQAEYYCHKSYLLEVSHRLLIYNFDQVYTELSKTLNIEEYYRKLLGYKQLYENLSRILDVEYISIIDFYIKDYATFVESLNTKIKTVEESNKKKGKQETSKVFVLCQELSKSRLYNEYSTYFRRALRIEWNTH
jgi:hypothetical protein